ncbi:MAG: hypothetical protein ABIG63_05990, partial [Chloroflexota bacterium]
MSTKNILYLLLLIIALTLAACAPAAAIDPTRTPIAPTATATPTATVTPPPTVTPTATATAIPATPEYDGELIYDPVSQTLYDAQATPAFVIDESGGWVAVMPELPPEAPVFIPEGFQVSELGLLQDPETGRDVLAMNPEADWERVREE